MGEVGSIYPIHGEFVNVVYCINLKDFEKRAIKATAEVQELFVCGVSFHPGRNAAAPFEIIRLYLEAGVNALCLTWIVCTISDSDQLLECAKFGCYIQYDLFGMERSYYQLNSRQAV
uniref:Uncharacterized protein n=1 Tax=Glossina austeni TaxID=7395 RepID=A0A1A9V2L1_GLOAU